MTISSLSRRAEATAAASHDGKRMPGKSAMAASCLLLLALAHAPAAGEKKMDVDLLPDGPAKQIVGRVCIDCHDTGNFRKHRSTSDEWSDSVADMVERGAKATPAEVEAMVAYLTENFGPESPVRINTAPFAEIKVVLGFTVAETRALLNYRERNGPLKNLQDLLKVPGIDAAKAESRKPQIAF